MKVLIIGGSHAGLAAAIRLKQIDKTIEVTLVEKTAAVGFISSSLKLTVEGNIQAVSEGKRVTQAEIEEQGIHLLLNTEAVAIDLAEKSVDCQYEETIWPLDYDYLILAMGSKRIANDLDAKGINLVSYKDLEESTQAFESIQTAQEITLIGGGYAGLELANALVKEGKVVNLVERMNNPLFRYYDQDVLTEVMENLSKAVNLYLNEHVMSFSFDKKMKNTITKTHLVNDVLNNDLVITNAAFVPKVDIVPADIQRNFDDTIQVDAFFRTTDASVFAIGDIVSPEFSPVEKAVYSPLVSNAVNTGIFVANTLTGRNTLPFSGIQKTTATKLFGFYLGSTGLSEEEAPYYEQQVATVKQDFCSQEEFIRIKLVYNQEDKRILGGQIISKRNQTELANLLSVLINLKVTMYQLAQMDFFYNPVFSLPIHPLKVLANTAIQ